MTAKPTESHDHVAVAMASLRSAIANGKYPPGRRLKEVEIAESLDMSRTPVREAIRRLVGEGLLELTPNRGAAVPQWSDRDLDEMFEVRAQLEGFAARLAAARATPEEVTSLRELCDRMERFGGHDLRAEDWNEYAVINNQFHRDLLRGSDNRRLETAALGLMAPSLLHNQIARQSTALLDRSNQHHAEIVDAIAAGDESWAEAITRTHVVATRNKFIAARGDDAVAP
ncbi:GntR family transcriptional regulator [Ilumatobacter coccineus]|uniref:Putative GntR family transcriptional regulator n=1 Tax=Ilumatobacter coccineus (strain NBRC 103263 / KCTC 29153 / YM16-304) TaxID=1313172 RepID=A0A6C7E9E8_ILUCY|nr:GntR family transcriptional regulator [Ilumatobacter coccineus]BAN04274.1 putative GntR family transcriptional regulator [Ilumatobacter coccineus YM16-304]